MQRIIQIFRKILSTIALTTIALSTSAQYQINGDANQISCNCYQLTQDVGWSGGSVWNVNQINLNNPFNYNFEVWLDCDEWGADGIAFVLQPVNVTQGGGSSSLGYGGIAPSLIVEIDTWPNDVTMMDPPQDHIAIMQNGDSNHGSVNNLAGPVVASSTQANIEDCQWHTVQIIWEPSLNTLAVFFDGAFRTSYTGNIINTIFGGNPSVYWGWTGGTGSASSDQRFCNSILPDYTITNNTTCVGQPINFVNASLTSSGNISNFTWNFGDGGTGSGAPISHTYNSAGTFNVNLSITTEGCTEDTIIPITIHPIPAVNLGPNLDVCVGQSIQLNNPNTLGAGTYSWSPTTNLSNASVASPTASPPATASYTLTYTSTFGCSGSDAVTVNVNPLPIANAGPDVASCQGDPVGLSASGGVSYSWTPAASLNNAGIANPMASPATTTVYTVTVTDANNCSATDNATVSVVPAPPLDAGANVTVCAGSSTQLNAVGTGTMVWAANPALSSTSIANPMASPATTTTFYVTITDANNCSATDSVIVTVEPIPVVNLGTDLNMCIGQSVQLNNPNSLGAGTYSWTPVTSLNNASAQSPITSAVSTTTYTLNFTSSNGCSGSDAITVNVNQLPIANAGADVTSCEGYQVALLATGGVGYSWTPAATLNNAAIANPIATPAATTVYTVTVTDANSCSNTDNMTVNVVPAPAIDAGANANICEGDAVQLNAIGTGSFAWSPGADLSSTVIADPIADPIITTTYYVTLTDANNCSSVDSLIIDVDPIPVASFPDPVAVCAGNPVQFSNNSTGTIVTYTWDFGDGLTGTGPNPSHVYPGLGQYNVTLTTVSANGCDDSTTGMAEVIIGPTPSFSIANGPDLCEQETLEITNNSSGPIVTYLWDFGNGSTSTSMVPTFDYTALGNYTISLTVGTADQCFTSITEDVVVHPIPQASFASSLACSGSSTAFTDLSSIVQGTIAGWEWQFGDATNIIYSQSPTHTYSNFGTFSVSLIAQSAVGCRDTSVRNVFVNPTPAVAISGSDVCLGDNISFVNSTVPINNTIAQWNWDFGDAQSANVLAPSHNYSNFGDYTVSLTALSDSGCVGSNTTAVKVYPYPNSDFSLSDTEGCTPVSIQFTDQSTINSNYSIGSYLWLFGNGATSTQASPSYTYAQPGIFDVSLITTTQTGGCTDTLTLTQGVSIFVTPNAAFNLTPTTATMLDPRIRFDNTTSNGITYWWDFGDGNSSTAFEPMNSYPAEGDYQITLTAINGICTSTTSHWVRIDPETFIYIPNSFTPNADRLNDGFIAQGIGIEKFSMTIYTRWGEEVYFTSTIDKPWDGTFKGMDCPAETYVYRVDILDVKGDVKSLCGSVNLIR